MARTPTSKGTSRKKKAPAASSDPSPLQLDEHLIRERAYGIWVAEGRPHGQEFAHWRRASLEIQGEAR